MTYIKINDARTRQNTRTHDGKPTTKYSPYETGMIEGDHRQIMAVIADSAGFDGLGFDKSVGSNDDSWHVLNTFKQGQYVDTMAIGGAIDEEHAIAVAKTQLDHLGAQSCVVIKGSDVQFDSMNDMGKTWSIDALSKLMDNASQDKPFLPMITATELNAESARICFDSVSWNESATLLSHSGAGSRLHLDMVRADSHKQLVTKFDLKSELAAMGAVPLDEVTFDALMDTESRLDLMKNRLFKAMNDASTDDLKVENMTVTKPFKSRGLVNIAFVFDLSDGQTLSIWFHNPDSTPGKVLASDIMISWKWLLNKRDVTAVLSPKQGDSVDLRVLAKRMILVASKNSKRFKSTQVRVAKDAQDLLDAQALIDTKNATIAQLDVDISDLNKQIDAAMKAPTAVDYSGEPPVSTEPYDEDAVDPYEVQGILDQIESEFGTDNEFWHRSIKFVQALSDTQFTSLAEGLEGANYHTQNVLYHAKRTGVADFITKAEAILEAQEDEGHLTPGLSSRRNELSGAIEAFLANPIDDTEQITITGNEIDVGKSVDFKTAKNNAMAYFDKNLRDKVIFCPAIDSDVLLRRRGGKHIAKSNNTFRDKLQLVAAIPGMIKQGKYSSYTAASKNKNPNIEGYYVLQVNVMVGDVLKDARVVLEKNNEGEVLYDIGINKKEALAALGDTKSNKVFDGFSGSSQYQDFLDEDYQENSDEVKQFDKLSTEDLVLNIFFDDDVSSADTADATATTTTTTPPKAGKQKVYPPVEHDGKGNYIAYMNSKKVDSWTAFIGGDGAFTVYADNAMTRAYRTSTPKIFFSVAELIAKYPAFAGIEQLIAENEAKQQVETMNTDDANNKVTEGRANESTTVKGTKVSSNFALVEAKNLITSHNAQGVANSNFPQELQPRDRSDKKSVESIAANAKNLEPEKLGDTEFAGNGAPIVGDDLIVESGNGRAIAIKLAYDNDDAGNYKEWLASNADSFGLSAEEVNSYDQPVLVRIRKSKIDRISFAIEANLDANDKYLNDNADEMPQPEDGAATSNAPTLNDSLSKRINEIQAIIEADNFNAESVDPAELEDLMTQAEGNEALDKQLDEILALYQNKLVAISMAALAAMTGGA